LLTAGEWKDLENWDFFRGLLDAAPQQGTDFSGMDAEWGYDFSERVSVTAVADSAPVTNVLLTLRDAGEQVVWQAMTDAKGNAELYPGLFADAEGPYTLTAESGEEVVITDDVAAGEQVALALTGSSAGTGLDLMFMVDTTGSMSDELSYLQTELKDVIQRVVTQSEDPLAVRLSVNFYRDTTDEYVVRSFPFTQDIDTALTALQQQYAGGGGDFPEAVDFALEVANQHAWNPKARARLMFLVLDAPPHSDQATQERVRQATAELAKQGVEVIPLTASGIDKPTEFLMRFLGAATNGSYTFLTDHSGIGGGHLDPHPSIGDYDVEMLNDLLVRIVSERVARPTIALQPL
jgi:Mg-chelatase subunit ChlD